MLQKVIERCVFTWPENTSTATCVEQFILFGLGVHPNTGWKVA